MRTTLDRQEADLTESASLELLRYMMEADSLEEKREIMRDLFRLECSA